MSNSWIPDGHTNVGSAWVDLDAMDHGDAICGYFNVEMMHGKCHECGSQTLMLTNVEFSLKSIVEDFYLDHGKVYQPDIPGALTGDQICTCLHCGEVEEGSAPFGLCVPLEDGDQSGD